MIELRRAVVPKNATAFGGCGVIGSDSTHSLGAAGCDVTTVDLSPDPPMCSNRHVQWAVRKQLPAELNSTYRGLFNLVGDSLDSGASITSFSGVADSPKYGSSK